MREYLGRALHDVAQVLESADRSEERLLRVLEILRRIVPYELCALFETRPGRNPRLLAVPAPDPDLRATLFETLTHLHRQIVNEHGRPPLRATHGGSHLAIPLVGNDNLIGVLFVRSPTPDGSGSGYTEQHLRELSIVGANLAGYLVMLAQARVLDEGRLEAEAANRRKDEFLALVSHELKTPMTSTLAWAHMLSLEEMSPSSRTRAVAAIERSVHTQAKLIDEILDVACIVTANLRLDLAAVDPASLVKAAVEEQRLRAEQRSIRLETVIDESVNRLVVDPVRIVQVISNLLAKAIHFTASGGSVEVSLDRVGAHARIQVIDHGKGLVPKISFESAANLMSIAQLARVPRDVLPHVLDGFHAGKDPITRVYGELGLGLAIVKTLVEAHGGRVRAESLGEENGSAVTVELLLPIDEISPPLKAPAGSDRPLGGIRVLLVDDDDDMRMAAGTVLEQYGAIVTSVASAAAALEALDRSRPDVLLSDISMAGENGYDLMRKVAAHDATLPAAAMTALAREEDRSRARAAGFRMHLAKPFDGHSLVAAVATLSGRPLAKGWATAITH